MTATSRPPIVVLCGSTRYRAHFERAFYDLEMAGHIVLPAAFPLPGQDAPFDVERKAMLDDLWRHKIRLADRVHVINPGGYLGESTRGEIAYAESIGRPVTYLEPAPVGAGVR